MNNFVSAGGVFLNSKFHEFDSNFSFKSYQRKVLHEVRPYKRQEMISILKSHHPSFHAEKGGLVLSSLY